MSDDQNGERMKQYFHDLAQSLTELRDRLGEMSLSLHDLAYDTDLEGRTEAAANADQLLDRLRRS